MPIELVPYTLNVPKEIKEVIDAQHALTKHFVNGGDLAGAASYIPALLQAVEGVQKVGEEIQSEYQDEAAGYAVHKVWDSLKKDVPVQP
jgi:hypothetical protein